MHASNAGERLFFFFLICHQDAPALLVENSLSRKEGHRRRHTCHGREGNGKSLREEKQDGCFFVFHALMH